MMKLRGRTANFTNIQIYFRRWYSISETELSHMIFPSILSHSKGIIKFEQRELNKNQPMMSKRSQKQKFKRRLRKQLKSIWNEMWPKLQGITDEKYKRMMEFRKRMEGK